MFTSPTRIDEEGFSNAIWELRASCLRYILAFTIAGHFLWHTLFTAVSPFDAGLKAWIIFPLVVAGELVSYRLLLRNPAASAFFFVAWSLVCCTAAGWLFPTSDVLFLYPLITLVATIALYPLAGLLIAAVEAILLVATSVLLPASSLGATPHLAAILASALTALFAWTLVRDVIETVDGSLDHYEQARRHMRDAQDHRAKLVQALKQLDVAYYRLHGANAALAIAWRAAESAERAKAELVANISHELRTPLNLIVGFSEMMISAPETYGSQPLPREYRTDLNAIYRSAQHLLDLTDDVLDLAQAGVNRLVLVRDRINLADIVRDAVEIVGDYINAKGLRLNVAIDSQLPAMSLDRLRIRQVFLNLLSNAARFTVRGSISIEVCRNLDEVVVTVTDTGPGISADKVDRMFEEFHHVDELAAREHMSTGLGLAISKRFIELHRGSISVESELGVGTSFRITLPVEGLGDEASEEHAHWAQLTSPSTAQPPLILADESPSLRRLLQRRLDSYRIVPAAEPEKARSLAEELKAAAIIADLATPIGSVSTPVIRCSLRTEHAAAKTIGVTDYLVKPVTQVDLRAAIDRLGIPINRILLADDDPHAVRLLTRMLSIGGSDYELMSAHNGDEALAAIGSAHPDLVILDLAMPGRSGHEFLEAVQADPELSTLPIIIVSAFVPEETALPTSTELSITKTGGMSSPEILNVIESVLRVLALPRSYLPATSATLERDRSEIMA